MGFHYEDCTRIRYELLVKPANWFSIGTRTIYVSELVELGIAAEDAGFDLWHSVITFSPGRKMKAMRVGLDHDDRNRTAHKTYAYGNDRYVPDVPL